MGDDLMGLAVVVVIAGGAFYLLTRNGNFNLGPDASADVVDPGVVTGGVGVPTLAGQTCTQLCQAGNCVEHAARYCSGCSKCPNALGKSAQCASWCKAHNCVEYRSQCNGACSNCPTSNKCRTCPHGYVSAGGPGCTCRAVVGDTFTGRFARTRSYTGRVTFNESAPSNNPNSIPMMTKPAMSARLY